MSYVIPIIIFFTATLTYSAIIFYQVMIGNARREEEAIKKLTDLKETFKDETNDQPKDRDSNSTD